MIEITAMEEKLLNSIIEQLDRGESPQAILDAHPEQAEDIKELFALLQATKEAGQEIVPEQALLTKIIDDLPTEKTTEATAPSVFVTLQNYLMAHRAMVAGALGVLVLAFAAGSFVLQPSSVTVVQNDIEDFAAQSDGFGEDLDLVATVAPTEETEDTENFDEDLSQLALLSSDTASAADSGAEAVDTVEKDLDDALSDLDGLDDLEDFADDSFDDEFELLL